MKTDIEICQNAVMRPIPEIAEEMGIPEEAVEQYGKYKAKIDYNLLDPEAQNAKVILVTAINPTPAGEGKTTTSVGLGDALNLLGKKTVIALREPSLGPVFGIKGGAAGGGLSQVLPMEDINLHFTGDMHAIGAANNLLAALIDNHIHQGNELHIDTRQIIWKRCVDMNDRQLRHVIDGLGGPTNGVPRQDGFNITVASEIMAILCLANDISDLKERLERIVVAYNTAGQPVTAGDLKAHGAMAAILKDALKPNLVQTLAHSPAFIHGGPFANIAHGCNSIIATKLASQFGDYVVTEAGFGADLGAEKFLDIKCRMGGIRPSAVVVVATIRALKYNGGAEKEELSKENLQALEDGFPNLLRHVSNIREVFGLPAVVAINEFPTDSDAEVALASSILKKHGIPYALSQVWAKGGEGGTELAEELLKICESQEEAPVLNYAYPLEATIKEKVRSLVQRVYHGRDVIFSPEAERAIESLEELGYDNLPICMAKTQYSFSDDPNRLGAPEDFDMNVKEVRLSAGAGFIVVLTGAIMTMPGLPKTPAAEKIDVMDDGTIVGLF